LIDLASAVTPIRPPANVWAKIERRVRSTSKAEPSRASHWRTRYRWAMAASVAMLVVALTMWNLLSSPATQVIATIADQQQTQLWRIEASVDRQNLRIEAFAALRADTEHAYELWALSASGGAPVSLGLMPQSDKLELQLDPTQRTALASATQVAISLEPVGGSPTGAPTGPVLYVATLSAG
jgi:anti-sigma-K factor RskA